MVSIIIPTYNRAELLCKTIDSIISQTYCDVELIIVDDGSIDDTEILVNGYDKNKVKYFKLPNTGNIAKLRNFGIQKSTFDIIAFCDDDDLWIKDKLEYQIPLLEKYDLICTNGNLIDLNNNIVQEKYFDTNNDFVVKLEDLIMNNYVLTPTVICKKSILKENSFEESKYKNLCEDYFLWLKIAPNYSIYFISKPLVSVRRHMSVTQNFTNKIKLEKNQIELISAYKFSPVKEIKNSAFLSILNRKIYLIKLYFDERKFREILKLVYEIVFSLRNPGYLNAFIFKVKFKLKKLIPV